ncbi:hypothetical protein EHP00_808 [Ecytonucleospora hepatopenaei]|uniref:Uncharacterized protein n=1 Tax=Ecytonucleospora hepatopenaei TaxID=646526 RepID=A0A1W0E7R6_9MICR|nr:hypothetical protein EHP00_808 [Ecytonucleospora hepatopenaei]
MEFKRHKIGDKAFYTLNTQHTSVLLDHTVTFFGKNTSIPTFEKKGKEILFIKDLTIDEDFYDVLFVTQIDVGAIFTNAKKIYISKPVCFQILILCEKYMNMHVYYEDLTNREIREMMNKEEINYEFVKITKKLIEEFKRKVIYVNIHEELQFLGFKTRILSSGINLGYTNIEFVFDDQYTVVNRKEGKKQKGEISNSKFFTKVIYCTGWFNETKIFKHADALTCDFLIINKIEYNFVIGDKTLCRSTIPMIDEYGVRTEKIKDVKELMKINNITDEKLIENKKYTESEEDNPETKEKQNVFTKEEQPIQEIEIFDQLRQFNIFLINAFSNWKMSMFIRYDFKKNMIDLLVHVLYNFRQSNINVYVVMRSFDRFYRQINNQTEWLDTEFDSEPFPFKEYTNFKSLENLNFDFPQKQKIIFVDKFTEIPKIFDEQIIVDVNCEIRDKKKVDKIDSNLYYFSLKLESTISEIVKNTEMDVKRIFINEEIIEMKKVKEYVTLSVIDNLHVEEGTLFLNGELTITDFNSRNKVKMTVKQKDHWIQKLMLENEWQFINDTIIISKINKKFRILETGFVEEIEE